MIKVGSRGAGEALTRQAWHGASSERFAVVGYTIALDIKLLQPPIHPWRVSAFGMTQTAPGFMPLGSVRDEIDRIVRDGRGRARFDSQFTREALMDAVASVWPSVS